jgi:TPR repeat protein
LEYERGFTHTDEHGILIQEAPNLEKALEFYTNAAELDPLNKEAL